MATASPHLDEYSEELWQAAEGGDKDTVISLLKKGVPPDKCFNKIIHEDPTFINETGPALHVACRNGHTAVVEALLSYCHEDINSTSIPTRLTALHWACLGGYKECAQLLIRAGGKVDTQDACCETPLHRACTAGHVDCTDLMIQEGCPLNIQDSCGYTPLHKAALMGHADIVERLIHAGCRPNTHDTCEGCTPLHLACMWGHVDTVRTLLSAGADVHKRTQHGSTPLHLASSWNQPNVTVILCKAGADMTARDIHGQTPVYVAVSEKRLNILQVLIERCEGTVYLSSRDLLDLRSRLNLSEDPEQSQLMQYLENSLQYGSKRMAELTQEALFQAALRGDDTEVNRLAIIAGDVNIQRPSDGSTPLTLSTEAGHLKTVQVLLAAGANPHIQRNDGATSLTLVYNNRDIYRALHTLDEARKNLLNAAINGAVGEVKRLKTIVGDVNVQRQEDGATPLILATEEGHMDTIQTLLVAGADPNIQRNDGRTALHLACAAGNGYMIRKLVNYGADVNIRDDKWSTCLSYAPDQKQSHVKEVLCSAVSHMNEGLISKIFVKNFDQLNNGTYEPQDIPCSDSNVIAFKLDERDHRTKINRIFDLISTTSSILKTAARETIGKQSKPVDVPEEMDTDQTEGVTCETSNQMTLGKPLTESLSEADKASSMFNKSDRNRESLFVVKTSTHTHQPAYYGLFAPSDVEKWEKDSCLTFFYDQGEMTIYLVEGSKQSQFEVDTVPNEHNVLTFLTTNLVKYSAGTGEPAVEWTFVNLLPLCVCRNETYEDNFPSLLSGVPKVLWEHSASPALPELEVEETDTNLMYKDSSTGQTFDVSRLSDGAKYFDLVARTLEMMKLQPRGHRCVIFQYPDRSMAPPLIREFVGLLESECEENKLQIILEPSSCMTRSKCSLFEFKPVRGDFIMISTCN